MARCSATKCPRFAANATTCADPIKCSQGSIVYLHLWAAKTNGVRICSQVGLLTALTELDVGAMYATGTIPTQIGRLTRLEELYININYLTGTLPTQITALTRLTNFLVNENRLTGTVPPLPPSLATLHAYHHRFSGALVATGLTTCYPQRDSDSEGNCFVDLPSECAKSPTRISLANGTSTPAFWTTFSVSSK